LIRHECPDDPEEREDDAEEEHHPVPLRERLDAEKDKEALLVEVGSGLG
jgi:hypothetical protein